MERCAHDQACWNLEQVGYSYRCPDPPRGCGLFGLGTTLELAKKNFRTKDLNLKLAAIKRKKDNGETLSRKEEQILAYSPKPFGTATGCSSCYQGVSIRV